MKLPMGPLPGSLVATWSRPASREPTGLHQRAPGAGGRPGYVGVDQKVRKTWDDHWGKPPTRFDVSHMGKVTHGD